MFAGFESTPHIYDASNIVLMVVDADRLPLVRIQAYSLQ
jgi:hypothetical protein